MSSGFPTLAVVLLMGAGDMATREAFQWAIGVPDLHGHRQWRGRSFPQRHRFVQEGEEQEGRGKLRGMLRQGAWHVRGGGGDRDRGDGGARVEDD